jgi:hypothetical protein
MPLISLYMNLNGRTILFCDVKHASVNKLRNKTNCNNVSTQLSLAGFI